jgi:hypothetical protein
MLMSSRIVVAGIMALAQVVACLLAAVLPRGGVVHPLQTLAALVFVFGVPPVAFYPGGAGPQRSQEILAGPGPGGDLCEHPLRWRRCQLGRRGSACSARRRPSRGGFRCGVRGHLREIWSYAAGRRTDRGLTRPPAMRSRGFSPSWRARTCVCVQRPPGAGRQSGHEGHGDCPAGDVPPAPRDDEPERGSGAAQPEGRAQAESAEREEHPADDEETLRATLGGGHGRILAEPPWAS